MNKTGKTVLAFSLATFLATGGYKLIRGESVGLAEDVPKDNKVTIAGDIVINNNIEGVFSVFDEKVFGTLNEVAKEGAVVNLPGSDDPFTFMYNTFDDSSSIWTMSWAISNSSPLAVAYDYTVGEDGENKLGSTVLYHLDREKKVIKGLKKIYPEGVDAEPIYSIYRIDRSAEVPFLEYTMTAEQHALAEQQFKTDYTSFDSMMEEAEKGATSFVRPEKTGQLASWQGNSQSRGAYSKSVQSTKSTGRRG